MTYRFLLPTFAALAGVYLLPSQVHAQSIIAAPDGTNTTVSETAGDFTIENGTVVGSGSQINLFHSFDEFGLITGESATFENSAGATNIIGRVTGGSFSIIDGQIGVAPGTASLTNLYLLNPSGILFGTNASLNLDGSFSASTATGLAFGNALFKSLGANDFSALIGNPTGYVFGAEASPIVNAGNLSLESGQSLTLLGGQVVNSGTLSTSDGQILLAAVAEENLVRLSQPDSLLSLEFETVPDTFIQSLPTFTPSTLPALLTGAANVSIVTPPSITFDPLFPGTVITIPGIVIPTPAATGITDNGDGTFSLSGSPQFVAEMGTAVLGGSLESDATIVIEHNIVLDSDLDVSGDLTVEAVQALEISGDLIIPEGIDSIIFESADSINIGTILANGNNVDLTAGTSITTGDIDTSGADGGNDVDLTAGTSITTGDIDTSSEKGSSGSVTLQAQTSITTGDINAFSSDSDFEPGDIKLLAGTSIVTGDVDTSSEVGDAGNVILDPPGPVIFSSIDTRSTTGIGGDVTITSTENTVRGIGTIAGTPNSIATAGAIDDGSITITHGGGNTAPFDIGNASINGTTGAIATGADTLADGNPNEPFFGSFTAGDIQIIATDALAFDNETICVQDCITPDAIEAPSENSNALAVNPTDDPEKIFLQLENRLTEEFIEYLRPGLLSSEESSANEDIVSPNIIDQVELGQMPNIISLPSAQEKLLAVQSATGKKPALIYAVFGVNPAAATGNNVINTATASDPLELMLITAAGDPMYVPLEVTRDEVVSMAQRLRRQVSTPSRASDGEISYLTAAQQLYQWLVAPLQDQLDAEGIDTISFITDAGLRSTPLAALHDGKDFIIQNYNIGLMPSLSLTDLTYQDISNVDVLLAGTSTFADQAALPGVPVELASISSQWSSTLLQGDTFVIDTLKGERQQSPSGIIHLATHGEFNVGDLSKSHLYLHNQKLALTQIRTLGLHQPSVELITLSACQTALGNRSAELGFAGFAVLAGAKTSIASLWSVSDEASAGLMIEFYRQLQDSQPTIKAESLREAQLAMIRGDIFVDNDQLKGLSESQQLPAELTIDGQQNFSHPYYWAAFSLVGSPW